MKYKTVVLPNGTRLQSGIPKQPRVMNPGSAEGVLLRGVVTATYVTDDPQHPLADEDATVPTAVYCDVMVYGNSPTFIPKALVCQERSGLHSGHVWKPRAASQTITGDTLDFDKGANPATIDGDHVLVGFLNGNFNQPLILRALPHPASDVGNEELGVGHRLKLVSGDGDPDFWKHNGTYYGIHKNGDFYIDTTHANDGTLDEEGHEPDPPTDGKGSVVCQLPQDAKWSVQLLDMSDPLNPVPVLKKELTKDGNVDHYGEDFVWEVNISDFADPENPVPLATIRLAKDKFEIVITDAGGFVQALIDGGLCFKAEGKDGDAMLTVGDGAVKVAIADHLNTLWTTFSGTEFPAHTHVDGFGGTGPVNSGPISAWDTAIESTKVTIPDG